MVHCVGVILALLRRERHGEARVRTTIVRGERKRVTKLPALLRDGRGESSGGLILRNLAALLLFGRRRCRLLPFLSDRLLLCAQT